MKRMLLILLILPIVVSSQWRFQSENDPFEGQTSYGYVVGTGGVFPYENPQLVFRKRDGNIDIYIQDVGYVTGGSLEFSFGNPNEILSFELSPSRNNEAGFFSVININTLEDSIESLNGTISDYLLKTRSEKISNQTNNLLELINKLKAGSVAYVRFTSRNQVNRFRISLSNSTNVINRIIGDYPENIKPMLNEFQLKIDSIGEERRKEEKKEFEEKKKYFELLRQLPKLEYGLMESSFSWQEYRIEDVDSITYEKESWCYIDVYVWYKGKPTPVKLRGGARKLAICE